MLLKKKNPTTSGTRHQIVINKKVLSKCSKIVKQLFFNLHKHVGRSSLTGHITVYGRGSGVKRVFRKMEESTINRLGIIVCTSYNPNITGYSSLCFDVIRYKFYYINAITSSYSGSISASANKFLDLRLGYRLCLKNIPIGVLISSIQKPIDRKSTYGKAAGTFCQLLQRNSGEVLIRLPSSQIISIISSSYSTIGIVSNILNKSCVIGKAGRNRYYGFRPKVRGIAMNPIDHPHGGKTNGGMPSVTPWSKPTKGKPTVKKKKMFKL